MRVTKNVLLPVQYALNHRFYYTEIFAQTGLFTRYCRKSSEHYLPISCRLHGKLDLHPEEWSCRYVTYLLLRVCKSVVSVLTPSQFLVI